MILTGEKLHHCTRQAFLKAMTSRLVMAGMSIPLDLRVALLNGQSMEVADNVKIKAYVNHSRWVVDCPNCPGAELMWGDDLTFICLSCFNVEVEHKLIKIELPRQRKAIEALLTIRPLLKNRNWKYPETVKDLARENQEEGVK